MPHISFRFSRDCFAFIYMCIRYVRFLRINTHRYPPQQRVRPFSFKIAWRHELSIIVVCRAALRLLANFPRRNVKNKSKTYTYKLWFYMYCTRMYIEVYSRYSHIGTVWDLVWRKIVWGNAEIVSYVCRAKFVRPNNLKYIITARILCSIWPMTIFCLSVHRCIRGIYSYNG